jgi:hypothetical protein
LLNISGLWQCCEDLGNNQDHCATILHQTDAAFPDEGNVIRQVLNLFVTVNNNLSRIHNLKGTRSCCR